MWRFSNDLPANERPDGRQPDQFRDIVISWSSINTANGSAIVKLGNTTVVSGVTFEQNEMEINDTQTVEQIEEDLLKDLSNLIEVSVKFQPHCSFSFKIQANDQDTKESLIMSTHFKQVLKNANMFDVKQLIRVKEGKVVISRMYVEVLVEDYDGNGFDACNLALLASIVDCRLEDEENANRTLKLDNYPVSTTFCFKSTKEKGEQESKEIIFQDPCLDEEKIADGQFNIVINAGSKQLILLNKTGGEGVSVEVLKGCIKVASERANTIRKLLKSKQTKL